MFAANPSDPSLSFFTIDYIGAPENAVPNRRPARGRRIAIAVASAAVALGLAAGIAAAIGSGGSRPSAADDASVAAPGEFRLAPGNQQPPGVVIPLPKAAVAGVPGEFRLAPGNQQPPGVVVSPAKTPADGVPGEFRLGPGNEEPPGVVASP